MIDWLKDCLHGDSDEENTYYALDKCRTFNMIELAGPSNGWLIWSQDETFSLWIRFAVFASGGSDLDDSNVRMNCIFHGEGPSGNLRECRHTWWGENSEGYVFYPDGDIICAAFKVLAQWFDNMT